MTCQVFDKVLVLDTPLQNLQSEGNSRSFLDELTEPGEEEIIDVISDDSLPGFRPFEDKTTIKARKEFTPTILTSSKYNVYFRNL